MSVTHYSNELADKMCEAIATNAIGLRALINKYDFFPDFTTIFDWLKKHEYFRQQYTLAKQVQCDSVFESIMDIADDSSRDYYYDAKDVLRVDHENINRSKLRVEYRKWHLQVLQPKKYGLKNEDNAPDALSKLKDVKVDKCELREI